MRMMTPRMIICCDTLNPARMRPLLIMLISSDPMSAPIDGALASEQGRAADDGRRDDGHQVGFSQRVPGALQQQA